MKTGDIICKCGHERQRHLSEATYEITYCRACNCEHFRAAYKIVPVGTTSGKPTEPVGPICGNWTPLKWQESLEKKEKP